MENKMEMKYGICKTIRKTDAVQEHLNLFMQNINITILNQRTFNAGSFQMTGARPLKLQCDIPIYFVSDNTKNAEDISINNEHSETLEEYSEEDLEEPHENEDNSEESLNEIEEENERETLEESLYDQENEDDSIKGECIWLKDVDLHRYLTKEENLNVIKCWSSNMMKPDEHPAKIIDSFETIKIAFPDATLNKIICDFTTESTKHMKVI